MAGQVWAVNSLGGYMYSRQLSNVLRMAVQPLVNLFQSLRQIPLAGC